MHELSLCGSIVDIVTRRAAGRTVEAVHLQVGQLRQVVPDTLVYCWGLVTASTSLATAALIIEPVAARVSCPACGANEPMGAEPRFSCPRCGSNAITVSAGEEFLLTHMEVADAD